VKISVKWSVEADPSWLHPERVAPVVQRTFASRSRELIAGSADKVRVRVQTLGVGADSVAVKAYSPRPTKVEQFSGLKPKMRPRGADETEKLNNRNNWIGTFSGGYAEYRQKIGLPTGGFYFSNFGTAWRHFGNVDAPQTVKRGGGFVWSVPIGFRRLQDQVAATAAQDKRRQLFRLGPLEAAELLNDIFMPIFNDGMRRALTSSTP
jgi:hypothetical protein